MKLLLGVEAIKKLPISTGKKWQSSNCTFKYDMILTRCVQDVCLYSNVVLGSQNKSLKLFIYR